MFLQADKIEHLKAGAVVALFGAALGACVSVGASLIPGIPPGGAQLVAICAAVGALAAGLSAGITKEFADASDNVIYPGMHGVQVGDAVATSAPGAALFLVLLYVSSWVAQ